MKKAAQRKDSQTLLVVYFAVVFALFLTAANIANYLSLRLVLGIVSESVTDNVDYQHAAFWEDFLAANPEYIPGWLEIGRFDRAIQIDPNYKF